MMMAHAHAYVKCERAQDPINTYRDATHVNMTDDYMTTMTTMTYQRKLCNNHTSDKCKTLMIMSFHN